MKKIILSAAAIVFAVGLTFGQTVSEENFKKGVDYLNCKVVELSLTVSKTKGVRDQFIDKCNCAGKPDFEKIKACVEQNEKTTLELSNEINQLKEKGYKSDLAPEAAVKFLGEDVFVSNPRLDALAKDLKPETFNKLKYELKTEHNKLFPKTASAPGNTTTGTIVTSDTETENSLAKDDFWLNLTFLLALITFLLLATMSPLAYKIFSDFQKNIVNLKIYTKNLQDQLDRLKNPTPTFAKSNPNEIEKIKEKVNKLIDEVNKLNKFKETAEMSSQQMRENQPLLEVGNYYYSSRSNEDSYNRAAVPPRETFYLSTPNKDGSFDVKSASTAFNEGASIYRFTKINERLAEFQIDENESACQQALNYPDVNIQPACTAQNSSSDGKRRIFTIKAGRAELDADKWRIKEKAKIKYEH